ncbi:hypothetical protein [Kitasatospora griseola]|nr:hypothetical protein [Kitasatospora griseola]
MALSEGSVGPQQASPVGAMTDEVGVITSDLTVRTVRVDDGLVTVRV